MTDGWTKHGLSTPWNTIQRSEVLTVLTRGTAWMDLEQVMQSDSSWTDRTVHSSICVNSPERQISIERTSVVTWGWGGAGGWLQGGTGTFLEWWKCSKIGPWLRLYNLENLWETSGLCTSNGCILYPNKAVKKKTTTNKPRSKGGWL